MRNYLFKMSKTKKKMSNTGRSLHRHQLEIDKPRKVKRIVRIVQIVDE